jgi:osmotically-inducible protein OsmY
MTKRIRSMIIGGLTLSGVAVLGCDSSRTQESTGEYIDDSVISTKVKAVLLEDSALRKFHIGVATYKDTVQLSGFVDSSQDARRAAELAASVHGVTKVKNDVIVK